MRAEECSTGNKIYRGSQQQIGWYRRMSQQSGRQYWKSPTRWKKTEYFKEEDTFKESLGSYQVSWCLHYRGPRGEKSEKGAENAFKEIMTENSFSLGKETDIQIQETQGVSRWN